MKLKTCPDCNGDGVVDKDTDNERQCPTCGGLGFVPDNDDGHEEVIKTTTIACRIPRIGTQLELAYRMRRYGLATLGE